MDAFIFGFGYFPEDQVHESSKIYVKRFQEYIGDLDEMYELIKKGE